MNFPRLEGVVDHQNRSRDLCLEAMPVSEKENRTPVNHIIFQEYPLYSLHYCDFVMRLQAFLVLMSLSEKLHSQSL